MLDGQNIRNFPQKMSPTYIVVVEKLNTYNHYLFHRILVASRNVEAGEILFREKPLFVGPSKTSTLICLNCLGTQVLSNFQSLNHFLKLIFFCKYTGSKIFLYAMSLSYVFIKLC